MPNGRTDSFGCPYTSSGRVGCINAFIGDGGCG
jgi:hypothetical protein